MERYEPHWEETLPLDLARVGRPDEALIFVQRYGLLWHGPGATEFSEQFRDWERVIRDLNFVMLLYEVLREATSGDLDAVRELREIMRPFQPIWEIPAKTDEEFLRHAGVLVAHLLTEGYEEAPMGITTAGLWPGGDPSQFMFMARGRSLVAHAYQALAARVIVQRVPLRECAECRRFFVVRRTRHLYCDPTCSGRARQRKWAEGPKGQKRRKQRQAARTRQQRKE